MRAATRANSRALTIHAALERLGLLSGEPSSTCLVLHLLGADAREGSSLSETAALFAPLCEALVDTCWLEVDVLLCGPNCVTAAPGGCAPGGTAQPAVGGPVLRVLYSSLATMLI